jgi:hypothetical protein
VPIPHTAQAGPGAPVRVSSFVEPSETTNASLSSPLLPAYTFVHGDENRKTIHPFDERLEVRHKTLEHLPSNE